MNNLNNLNLFQYSKELRYNLYGDIDLDICNECTLCKVNDSCNKCGEGVCISTQCCELFPHYSNTTFVICRSCVTNIDNKLQVLFNYNDRDMHLQLLKIKIKKRLENKIEKKVEFILKK